ncbi:MAG: signal peptidase I [Candidatus Paceibacterota bacterium]
MKQPLLYLWEISKIVIIALLIVAPIRYFLFQPFLVHGSSMEPNFHNGDYLIIDEVSYRFRDPKRGEVIVFHYPEEPKYEYIKRIVGLPGETVKVNEGKVTVYSKDKKRVLKETYLPASADTPGSTEVTLNSNEYFVLGDNRTASSDSRRWGPLKEKYIVGRVWFHLQPLSVLNKFKL